MNTRFIRTAWDNFPPVKVLYPSKTLINASESLYLKAKSGCVQSAFELLYKNVISQDDILTIGELLLEYDPILAPVLAEERLGKNRIPAVFAEILASELNLDVTDDIVQIVKANHTNATAYERIVRQPIFDGAVTRGRNYVILDDTVSMGGTLAALKGYIESKGGCVILATAITGYLGLDLKPNPKTLNFVKSKHPQLADWWLYEFGFPLEYLTQGELGHFKKPDSLDTIRNRLIEAGFQTRNEEC